MKEEGKKVYKTYVDDSIYKRIKIWSLLKKTLLVLILILAGNFLVAKIFNYNLLEDIGKKVLKLAGIYTEPIPSITMESNGWKDQEEGSYQIIKSAKWNGRSEAKITLDVKSVASINSNKDVIFVLDRSGSMKGDRIQKLKEDSIELIENMLNGEKDHQVALITFSTDSEIVTNFTKDKSQMIKAINSMEAEGTTNYNAAFKNVMKVLQDANYHRQDGRELVIMFLTDGRPCEDTPNEVATYSIFKEQYPYAIVNGVEYEMGTSFSYELVVVSDKQFKAWMENLDNVLLEAAVGPDKYEEFTITDYIENEYFEVKDKSDIKVLVNGVETESKFDLVNENGKQKVVWDLTENYVSGAEITMEIKIQLKDEHTYSKGYYPTNSELNIESKLPNLNKETHNTKTDTPVLSLTYEVIYDTNPPKACNSIKRVEREDHFVFENVTKRNTVLTCDGYIFKGWEVVEEDVTQINNEVFVMPLHDVQVRGIWSKPVISKAMDGTINEKTTLYRTVEDEFETGSEFVSKYEGEADDSYANPGANENIYYYQGAATTNNVIFGGFCWQMVRTTKTGGVKMVYNGLPSEDNKCNNTGTAQQLAQTSKFNSSYSSPAYVGYMYNQTTAPLYEYKSELYVMTTLFYLFWGMENEYQYYISQRVTYDSATGNYTLVDPQLRVWGDVNNDDYIGWYFCNTRETKTCKTIYYITGIGFYGSLKNGAEERQKYTFGKSYIKNSSGTYTLQEIVQVDEKDFIQYYGRYNGYYTCSDYKSTTCSELHYVYVPSGSYQHLYTINANILFGNSFTYTNGSYTLTDAKTYDELKGDFSSHHYTCFNNSGKCTSIRYYYYIDGSNGYYIDLANGKSVEKALEDMLWVDDVNQKDSDIKSFIDAWYAENIEGEPFEEYIEDTIYCNDRSISELNGWDPNGGSLTSNLYFGANHRTSRASARLTCSNETDRFSVSNPKAQLTYPVGLITLDEIILAGNNRSNYLGTGQYWWLGSPYNFVNINVAGGFVADSDGSYSYNGVNNAGEVRPAVSLRPNTEYSSGTGTADDPYIISVGS